MSDLTELLERVEKATGPSVEIDGLFAKLDGTIPQEARFQTENVWCQKDDQWISGGYGAYQFYSPEEVSGSIDAALALVERRGLDQKAALEYALLRPVARLPLSICEFVVRNSI